MNYWFYTVWMALTGRLRTVHDSSLQSTGVSKRRYTAADSERIS